MGLSGAFHAFSNEELGSILGLEPKILHVLPDYKNDLFVVAIGRMNRFNLVVLDARKTLYLSTFPSVPDI